MQNVTIEILLAYVWNFAIICVISSLGCFSRDVFDTLKNNTRINARRIFVTAIFNSIILCALFAYISCPFQVFMLIAFILGWIGDDFVNAFTPKRIIDFIIKLLKNLGGPVVKAISETFADYGKTDDPNKIEDTKKLEDTKSKPKKKKDSDGD